MKKLLIADDEPLTLEILNDFFTMCGFEVLVTEDGHTAYQRFKDSMPDAAILDLQMPGMGGDEAARLILAEDKNFPIIILSGFIEKYSADDLISIGVRELIEKPVNLKVIKQRIDDIFKENP